jgi:hypothetical protein
MLGGLRTLVLLPQVVEDRDACLGCRETEEMHLQSFVLLNDDPPVYFSSRIRGCLGPGVI